MTSNNSLILPADISIIELHARYTVKRLVSSINTTRERFIIQDGLVCASPHVTVIALSNKHDRDDTHITSKIGAGKMRLTSQNALTVKGIGVYTHNTAWNIKSVLSFTTFISARTRNTA